MAQTWWLDEHNMWASFLGTVAMQLACFCVAYLCRFDLITDLSGAANFVVIAIATLLLGGTPDERRVVVTLMVVLSRCELGAFLLYRVCKRSKDARFDEMRESCVRFLIFWIFQMVWVFLVSVPVVLVNGSDSSLAIPLGPWDVLGIVLFVVGWSVQVLADLQKYRFRSDPLNAGKFCDRGVWRYSRHPNFFGEIVLWWGVFSMAVPVLCDMGGWAWLALCSPAFTMAILLYLSGLPTAEGEALAKVYKAGGGALWEEYARTTAPLWMLPPGFYAHVPRRVKWLFCCEFKFLQYQTQPASSDSEEPEPSSSPGGGLGSGPRGLPGA